MRRWCPAMPGLPVPMLRPGGKARPRGGNDGYGCRAGGGAGHGKVESESWQIKQKRKDNEQRLSVSRLATVHFHLNTTIKSDVNWVCFRAGTTCRHSQLRKYSNLHNM